MAQLGAKMAQDPPTWSQDGPKIPHFAAKMAPALPNLETICPQTPPSSSQHPQDPQLAAKMTSKTSNFESFGTNLDSPTLPKKLRNQ